LFNAYCPEGFILTCSFRDSTSANSSKEGNTLPKTLSTLGTTYIPCPILSNLPDTAILDNDFRIAVEAPIALKSEGKKTLPGFAFLIFNSII
jgi:hypothetical protein